MLMFYGVYVVDLDSDFIMSMSTPPAFGVEGAYAFTERTMGQSRN